MKKLLLSTLVLALSYSYGQNVGINTTGIAPVSSAALDVDVANKGVLIPRVALTSTITFSPITGTAAISLMVYNTATAGVAPNNVTPGFYYWNGTSWSRFVPSTETAIAGDIKYGFQSSDHNGWIKLDGRSFGSLTTSQQAVATSLGLSGNLPDASGKVLKTQGSLNTTGGSNAITLTQANLPNYNMTATTGSGGSHSHTGTTDSSGDHSHSYTDYYYAENNGTNWGWAGSNSGNDWDNHGYSTTSTTATDGLHTHTFTTSTDSGHTHSLTVNSGGSAVAISVENAYLCVNTFIYLGY